VAGQLRREYLEYNKDDNKVHQTHQEHQEKQRNDRCRRTEEQAGKADPLVLSEPVRSALGGLGALGDFHCCFAEFA
jgi:hypothetical protein